MRYFFDSQTICVYKVFNKIDSYHILELFASTCVMMFSAATNKAAYLSHKQCGLL